MADRFNRTLQMTRTRRTKVLAAALALFWLLPLPTVWAQEVESGLTLARKWCGECHVVENNQADASSPVPSFEEIANRRGFDPEELFHFLIKPHPKPDMDLTRAEVLDLVNYMATLKNYSR